MIITILAAALATSAASPAAAHQATITQADQALQATYDVKWDVAAQDATPKFGLRQAPAVCRWQANVYLHRDVSGTQGQHQLTQPVHVFEPAGGTEIGRCDDVRGRIEAQLSRKASSIQSQAAQIAHKDVLTLNGGSSNAKPLPIS